MAASGLVDEQVPEVLWTPDPEHVGPLARFTAWVREHRGVDLSGYAELHDWSVTDLAGFWSAVAEFGEVRFHDAPTATLGAVAMPGTAWFPGATLNYAEHALSVGPGRADTDVAVVFAREDGGERTVTHAELRELAGRARAGLVRAGVGRGDRVVALAPNSVETLVAFLAAASLGAIWSSCSPDFGARAVHDRFAQIEPTVLIAVDGYIYGGKGFDITARVAALQEQLPTRARDGPRPVPGRRALRSPGTVAWSEFVAVHGAAGVRPGAVRPPAVGALLLGHHRAAEGHRARARRDRGGAPEGAAAADGSGPGRAVLLVHHHRLDDVELPHLRPARRADGRAVRRQPRPSGPGDAVGARRAPPRRLLRYVGAVHPGVPEGAACGRRTQFDLSAMRAIGSTGSPLSQDGFRWIASRSARTSRSARCPAAPTCAPRSSALPRPCRCGWGDVLPALGAAVVRLRRDGSTQIVDEVGELVITQPMPSMPVYFWNDPDGIPATRGVLRGISRASGGTATGSRSPHAARA